MSNLVIVAIPAKDDPVWKVSTEKVPHMTLLFLGEMQDDDGDLAEDTQRIVDFVGHAIDVSEHGPFGMDVDYRDTLGPDDADVLFFSKGWSFKWINQFRNQLLQQTDIKTAYDSTPQYEEWTPHLTLGYPTAPAKDDAVEYPINWVSFDRIAVWTGDYEGPEFRLKWPERDFGIESGLSVAYGQSAVKALLAHGSVLDQKATRDRIVSKVQSILEDVTGDADGDLDPDDPDDTILAKLQDLIDEFTDDDELAQSAFAGMLEHYGVKGMKWGARKEDAAVRIGKNGKARVSNETLVTAAVLGPYAFAIPRVRAEVGQARAHNKGIKADKKWEKKIYSVPGAVAVHNAMADHFNARIGTINDKPKYQNLDLHHRPNEKAAKDYLKEVDALTHEGNKLAVEKVHGRSPTGKKVAKLSEDGQSIQVVDAATVKHAAQEDPEPQDHVIEFKLRRHPSGKIKEMNTAELGTDAKHMADRGEAFILEHYGIKGMRWGQRKAKDPPSAVTPHAFSRVPQGAKRKTKIDTTGGENHPAHDDAIKVARAQAKLKKSGAAALSNQELRDVATRVQLEQQVSMLTGHKGKQWVTRQLRSEGENAARQGFRLGVRKGVKRVGVAALM